MMEIVILTTLMWRNNLEW